MTDLALASRRRRASRVSFGHARKNDYLIETITFCLYFVRDGAGGFLRWLLVTHGVSFLWFIPDFASFVCVFLFVRRFVVRQGNVAALLLVLWMSFSLYIGYITLGSGTAVMSSLKMITPIFVGFGMAGCDLDAQPRTVLGLIYGLLFLSIASIILSSRIQFPWIGFAYESFGAARQAGRLWWANDQQRLAGLCEDSTMAAFMTTITFAFTSLRKSTLWCIAVGAIALYAIYLTTNKTGMVGFAIYLACLFCVRILPKSKQFLVSKRICIASFVAPLIPVALMIAFSGADLSLSSRNLYSLSVRINESWQAPFLYLYETMPFTLLSGCGAGCFNYPMLLFSDIRDFWVPVDNFYLGTYLMFGLPFVPFLALVIYRAREVNNPYKLVCIFVLNIVTVTVLNYGPAVGLMCMAFGFSDVFVARRSPERSSPGQLSSVLPLGRRYGLPGLTAP